jgi:hypothetical protein
MIVLDRGCGQATISRGVAEAAPLGRVMGVILTETDWP